MRTLAELTGIDRVRLPLEPPCPEVPAGKQPVFLLDASTALERRLLTGWLRRCGFDQARVVDLASSRIRRHRRSSPQVGHIVEQEEDAWLIPLRVAWLPAERLGRRTVSWVDVIKVGDPRDPRPLREYLILFLYPDRVRILVGQGAEAPDLLASHADDPRPLTDFVTRRAWRALDRQERAERGDRYKIPRFVAEDIASNPGFTDSAIEYGAERGLSPKRAVARARYYIREIAASHSPFLIDLIANLIHWVIRRGYGAIHYDPQAAKRIAQLGRNHPLVYLPSHKSNLDRLSFQFLLWENDMPPNHTAGGINMNFFPVGPLVRRTGVFYIRRTFKGNELYKFVLRSYIDYLVERRFPLEWYMEGGRSRTGKLRPPRFGLLSWVVDSFKRKKADDVYLIPVSIAYDHIHEIGAYVAEVSGGAKEKESFTWALRFARNLRRRYGDIHIRFGEPVSMAAELGDDDSPDTDIAKLALEVMYRISMATPFTPTAIVATALLANREEGRDAAAIYESVRRLVSYVEERHLPTTVPSLPDEPIEVEAVLSLMIDHRLVSSVSAGDRTVYWTTPEQTLRAAYYANTVVHYFVPRALAEVALADSTDLDDFWDRVFALRDLMKFEFFFAEKPEFRRSIEEELAAEVPAWEEKVASGQGSAVELDPPVASFALLPVLGAYQAVADELVATFGTPDEKAFMEACLARARLYRLEGRIVSEQSVSQALFEGAVMLARNRGIWDGDATDDDRAAFAAEIEGYRNTINSRPRATAGL